MRGPDIYERPLIRSTFSRGRNKNFRVVTQTVLTKRVFLEKQREFFRTHLCKSWVVWFFSFISIIYRNRLNLLNLYVWFLKNPKYQQTLLICFFKTVTLS